MLILQPQRNRVTCGTIGGVMHLFGFRLRRAGQVVALCLAVMGGMFFARRLQLTDGRIILALSPLLLLALWRKSLALVLMFVLCFSVGWWRGSVYMQKLAVYDNLKLQKITLVGRAADDGVYGDKSQMAFSVDHLQVVVPYRAELIGNIGVKGFGAPAVARGDIVQVSGKLYPTRGNNLASISFAELKVLKSQSSPLENIRHRFVAGMQSALPEPQASFGLGLLVGQRSTLPDDTKQVLLMVGLTHIIAVSGYNLTIIVEVTRRLLGKLSKFQNTVICLSLIGVFLLITGSSPPIVRASIISVLTIWAWYYGRRIKPLALLMASAAITVLANPLYLWGNVSWYLSFLAFFGVLVLAPLITRRIFGAKKPNLLVQIFIESLCASVMTIPYILYIFGQVSLVALPANLLVVPFIPLAMLLSLVAGLAGMFIPAVAGWLAFPAKLLLTYMLDIATLLSKIPHAFAENLAFGFATLTLSYFTVAGICLILWNKKRRGDDAYEN